LVFEISPASLRPGKLSNHRGYGAVETKPKAAGGPEAKKKSKRNARWASSLFTKSLEILNISGIGFFRLLPAAHSPGKLVRGEGEKTGWSSSYAVQCPGTRPNSIRGAIISIPSSITGTW
jgi:hypothetical protein